MTTTYLTTKMVSTIIFTLLLQRKTKIIFYHFNLAAAVDSTSNDFDIVLKNAARAALRKGLVSSPDDLLVVTAGIPFGTPGAANVIRIMPAAGPNCWDGICQSSD